VHTARFYIADIEFAIDVNVNIKGQYDKNREKALLLCEQVKNAILGLSVDSVAINNIYIKSQELAVLHNDGCLITMIFGAKAKINY